MAKKPEEIVRDKVRRGMKIKGWRCYIFHGNQFQKGWPDSEFIKYEPPHLRRLVDFKRPEKSKGVLTPAQQEEWPILHYLNVGIWILNGWSELQYRRLFEPPNWMEWWKPRYGPLPQNLEEALSRREKLVDSALDQISLDD